MLMNNDKKEKKEPFSYELFPSENKENTFNMNESPLADDIWGIKRSDKIG